MKLDALVLTFILVGVNVQDINYHNISQNRSNISKCQNHHQNKYVKEYKLLKVDHLRQS